MVDGSQISGPYNGAFVAYGTKDGAGVPLDLHICTYITKCILPFHGHICYEK